MLVAIDSNVFISALSQNEAHSKEAQQLIREIANGKHSAIASSIIYGEVYSVSVDPMLIDFEGFLDQIDNLKTIPASDDVCVRAGKLRQQFGSGLKLTDAMHLATALETKADLFITNDLKLVKVAQRQISTKLLTDLY